MFEEENKQFFVLSNPFHGTKYRLILKHLSSHFSDLDYCRNKICTHLEQRDSIVYNISVMADDI